MAGRALLEALKYLDVKELLVTVSCVCKGWKRAAYSDEMMLQVLEDRNEDPAYAHLSLYKRVKKSYRDTRYLLNVAKGKVLIWDIHHPTVPSTEIHHSAFLNSSRYTLLSPTKAMVTGGVGVLRSCLQVDLKRSEVTVLPELLTDHAWHGVAYMNKSVYISGGDVNRAISSKAEKYTDGHWTAITDMTIARYNHTLCVYLEHVYAFGGSNGDGYQNSVEKYDGQAWSPTNMSLPSSRNYSSVLQVKNDLLLIAGYSPEGAKREVHLWRATTQKWELVTPISTDYSLSNAVAYRQGVLYIYNHPPSRDLMPLQLLN